MLSVDILIKAKSKTLHYSSLWIKHVISYHTAYSFKLYWVELLILTTLKMLLYAFATKVIVLKCSPQNCWIRNSGMEPSNLYLVSPPGDSNAHLKLENHCIKAWNSFAFPGKKFKCTVKVKFLPFAFLPRERGSFIILPHAISSCCPSLPSLAEYISSDPTHGFRSFNQTLSVAV